MSEIIFCVPDIGTDDAVAVIDVCVAVGSHVVTNQPLITLESDKASMDVPANQPMIIKSVLVKVGDTVKKGDQLFIAELVSESLSHSALSSGVAPTSSELQVASDSLIAASSSSEMASSQISSQVAPHESAQALLSVPMGHDLKGQESISGSSLLEPSVEEHKYAGPAVRKLARELGVDINRITGTAHKGRVTKDDIFSYVKQHFESGVTVAENSRSSAGSSGLSVLPWPQIDFAKYGEIERIKRTRIQKLSGENLHRNWVMIPHVTHNDEADITQLESFREQINQEQNRKGENGVKMTILAFAIKAVVVALKQFPRFNASIDGEDLIIKRYYHIGFAADTPNGLVVPVIKNADAKGLLEIAKEAADLAKLARMGQLKIDQMQGGTFSISSLGSIGGTTFTPIINAPEVAILGMCRSKIQPFWTGNNFEPRLMLPLSLSYDHRVIDGAEAARFCRHVVQLLEDFRRVTI